MIRAVTAIKTFGAFEDFRWPGDLSEFKRYNLLYGWNYSGKTTLSRVFRCFELNTSHPDFGSAQAEIKDATGTLHDLSSFAGSMPIRVFNSDFVRDNLSFDSAKANAVLLLGAEDIEKQRELDSLRSELSSLRDLLRDHETAQDGAKADLDRQLTKCARDNVKNRLAIPNYDKTKLEQLVSEVLNNVEDHVLSDEQYEEQLNLFQSTEKKAQVALKVLSLVSVGQLRDKIVSVLSKTVALKRELPHLAGNPALERWVDNGRSFHQGAENCHFCGNSIPPGLLEQLNEYFSPEYDSLMASIDQLQREVDAAAAQVVRLDDVAAFYPNLAERYNAARKRLEMKIDQRRALLDSLRERLEIKKTQAFSTVAFTVTVDDIHEELSEALAALNEVIGEHNARTSEFDNLRHAAQQKLLGHIAATFALEESYALRVEEISSLKAIVERQSAQAQELERKIRQIEAVCSDLGKGAARVNDLLAAYFGKPDIQIQVTDDNQFQLTRSGKPAKNLSEGEQTAIGFAYFITRVQDGTCKLEDQIIVIDDPISSLDANHIFNTYALIKIQLAGAKQLFVFTHNFEFYNLMRDWLAEDEKGYAGKPYEKWIKWSAYIVQRNDKGIASIAALPKELLKFKSEYHYLFARLYKFDLCSAEDFEQLLALPNLVRRFMEAFAGIMIPTHEGLRKKLPRLFADEIERERVWKFINHYSHQTSITRSLEIPDTSECSSVVRSCLSAVKNWDDDYYQDLVAEVAADGTLTGFRPVDIPENPENL